MAHMSQAEVVSPGTPAHWSHMPFSASLPADSLRYPKLATHLAGHGDHLGSSIDSLSDADYHMSPMSHSFPRDDIPFLQSPIMYEGRFQGPGSPLPQTPVTAILIEPRHAPTSCPSLVYGTSEPSSSLPSHSDPFDTQIGQRVIQECESIGTSDIDAYSTSAHSHGSYWPTHDEDNSSHGASEGSTPWPTAMDPPITNVSPELIARMPFFLDYYEHTMCPLMVFIDGPNNPFREHILSLATGSRSLQHAICALAACNLRMKRKLSLGQRARDLSESGGEDSMPEDQTLSEEYQHRNLAAHLLTEQLNDANNARHDSALATILILCHYRMAESGIAKFHTQFAGVKKILSMRRMGPFPPSRDSIWLEAIFTYFDAISASINDREAQLNTSFFGVMPDAQVLPLGSENLVGCDRELFKTIMKLGRLNLLSQHRPVQNLLSASPLSRPGMPSRSQSSSPNLQGGFKPTHQSHLSVDVYGSSPSRFDGNGFGTTLNDEDIMSAALSSSYDDHRSTFWREWKDARIALQSWEFDPQRLIASLTAFTGNASPNPPTSAQIRDLGSLSEAFRYAALLYTERLASPNVPSAHNNFRNLVSQVVYYATSLETGSSAEKFLLWPLFVAGSECVNELQQNIVRSKCREIMDRSGYMNNLAALDVLERLWAGDWKAEEGMVVPTGAGRIRGRGPFAWTSCIGAPGLELEWIMF